MKKHLIGKAIVFFLVATSIFVSCQQDERIMDERDVPYTKGYEKIKSSDEPLAMDLFQYVKDLKVPNKGSDSLNIPEDVLKTISESGKTTYSFGITLPDGSKFFRNLVMTKSTTGWVGYYIDFYPDLLWVYASQGELPNMGKFTGKTLKYDLYFNLIYTSYFDQGKIYKYVLNNPAKSQDICLQVTDAYFEVMGIGPVSDCNDGQYHSESTGVTYPCELVLMGYERPCSTSGEGSFSSPIWADGSMDAGTDIPEVGGNPGDGGTTSSTDDTNKPHGGGGGSGSTTTTIGVNNFILPKIDAKSVLDHPKIGCIYKKLVETNLMSRYTKKFDGEFPVSHLKYEIDSLSYRVLGRTIPPNTPLNPLHYWIVIQLNKYRIDELPVLEWACVLLHETIHAEMFRKMISVGWDPKNDNFPGLFDYYARYNNLTSQSPQHQLMADFYVNIIAQALSEFDKNQNPSKLYKDLAWEGLVGTDAWNALGETEQKRILYSIGDYRERGNQVCDSTSVAGIE